MAADWTYTPIYAFTIDPRPARTLVSRFGDGTELRRVIGANEHTKYHHRYVVDATTMKAMMTFLRGKGYVTSFKIISWDPEAADPSTDEVQAVVDKFPRPKRVAVDTYTLSITWRRVYGEP